ncbi:MAG: nucleotidyltransferase family protein, partial [Mycobacteriales bacterium]
MESDVCLEKCYPEPLLAIASYGLAAPSHVLPTRPLPAEAWSGMLASASSNRLLGLLCAAAEDGALPATREQLDQARQLQVSTMAWAMRLENALLAVVDLLTASAVEIRVLKGSAVAHLDYPDPALRSFIDIDLLVRSEQFDRAVELLTGAGFQRRYPQPRPGFDRRFSKGTTFLSPTGYELDLHRTFVQGPWGLLIDLNDLWDDGEEFEVAGRPLHALSRAARFMHACYHAALGDWPPRLSSLRDIAQMLLVIGQNEKDPRALATRWRAEAVLAVAVSDAWSLLGIAESTPTSVWAQIYVPNGRDEARLA